LIRLLITTTVQVVIISRLMDAMVTQLNFLPDPDEDDDCEDFDEFEIVPKESSSQGSAGGYASGGSSVVASPAKRHKSGGKKAKRGRELD
jgi:hypothetical protein